MAIQSMDTESCDVLVVGAGPAGIFAALGVSATSDLRVLVVDSGSDVTAREQGRVLAEQSGAMLVGGVGGAGLFSDGKLCFSLDVGGDISVVTTPSERETLLRTIREALDLRAESDDANTDSVAARADVARRAGLEFTYYPVTHIGTEYCKDRIVDLRNRIEKTGGEIRAETELRSLVRLSDDSFDAVLAGPDGEARVNARAVVLALGKVGAKFQRDVCRSLGVSASPRPMYVGIRIEMDALAAEPMFDGLSDPKYKQYFPDGSKIKTHCATNGGEILALEYEGLPLAGGHSYRSHSSGRSSVGILWDGIRLEGDAYSFAMEMMDRSARLTDGRLMVQRLDDFYAGRASDDEGVRAALPSGTSWAAGDLRDILPADYWKRFEEFLGNLERAGLSFDPRSTLLYGPAVEWWSERMTTDRDLQTEVPGLYVAGDGAGWSQGIVQSAATGLLVADAICRAATTPTAPRLETVAAALSDTAPALG